MADLELLGIALFATLIGFLALGAWERPKALRQRLRALTPQGALEPRQALLGRSVVERMLQPALAFLANLGERITPGRRKDHMILMLKKAGLSQPGAMQLLMACKFLGPLLGVVTALVGLPPGASLLVGLMGFMAPDAWLKARIRRRSEAIVATLPDMLDHLTSCIESGLSLDGAIQRIVAHPGEHGRELKQEFACYLSDMRLGQSRSEALLDLSRRCDSEELQGIVAAMLQAEQMGVSIGPVLRSNGHHLRTRRRQRAQEAAMKAPVKMLFPLILFIFPAMFVVILGPGVLRMIDTFSQLNH